MAIFRRRQSEQSESVELVVSGNGLVVQGSPSAVTRFVDHMAEPEGVARGRRVVVDGLAVAANVAAFVQTHREYFEFGPKALAKLREHGRIPRGDGWFQGFVRSGDLANSPFAGNLEWRPVSLGPEQALAMQTAVATLALRAAIKDVAAAVERVEGKVDKLVMLARAERLGSAMGDRLTLQSLVESTRQHGRISKTDWSTVAGLGSLISRDMAALRAYVLREIEDIDEVTSTRRRSAELEELTDDFIKESLALLVVAEKNYVLWQELRLANVASHEPKLLDQTIRDVRSQLASMTEADQAMLDALHLAASDLLNPRGYEGFALVTRRQLKRRGESLNETLTWFAAERQLENAPLEVELPTLKESIENARRAIASGLDSASSSVRNLVRDAPAMNDEDESAP